MARREHRRTTMRCDCGKLISDRMHGKCMACRYKHKMSKYKPKPIVTCPVCGKQFFPSTNQVYCSGQCRDFAQGRIKSIHNGKIKIGKCLYCRQEFEFKYRGREQLYCSHSCCTKYNNDKRNKYKIKLKTPPVLTHEQIAALPKSPPGPVKILPI